jgi:hypothetical protein
MNDEIATGVRADLGPDSSDPENNRILRIRLTSPDPDDLRSLERALLSSPDVRQRATIRLVGPPPKPGMAGPELFTVIELVAGVTLQTANLVFVIMQWRIARAATSTAQLERDGGHCVDIPDGPADLDAARELGRQLDSEP